MTYVEAISELQQRSLDALKVARSSQIASLQTSREFARTLSAKRPSAFVAPSVVRSMTDLTTAFAFALLEQQVAYAKKLADTFVKAPVAAPRLALSAPPLLAIAAAPLTLTTTAQLDVTAEPDLVAREELPAPDDAMSLATDEAISLATDEAISPATAEAAPLATDEAISQPPDEPMSLATDEAISQATAEAAPLVTDGVPSTPTDDLVLKAAHAAVSTEVGDIAREVREPSDPLPWESAGPAFVEDTAAEPAALAPQTLPRTEEVLSKTFAAPNTPSENSAFPASSANAARKAPKQPGSNPRPKQKRNPGK